MSKKVFLCFTLFLLNQTALAENFLCPSVTDIKNGHIGSWLPLYIEGEELASDQDVSQFKNQVTHFVEAKWNKDYLESGHCFYQGEGLIFNKIIFAHDAWRPEKNIYWVWKKSDALAECKANIVKCGFLS